MFFALSVPPAIRESFGRALQAARTKTTLKLQTIGGLMGISAEAVYQMERGQRAVAFERLALLSTDRDGRKFLEAFLQEIGELWGCEDVDAISAQLRIVNGMFSQRMAKAILRDTEAERKRA